MEDYQTGLIIALGCVAVCAICYSAKLRKVIRDHRAEIDAVQKSLLPADSVANNVVDAAQSLAESN